MAEVAIGRLYHYPSQEHSPGGAAHIKSIGGFWGHAKSRLAKFRGMSKQAFYLH